VEWNLEYKLACVKTRPYDRPIFDLDPRRPGTPKEDTLADRVFDWLTEQIVVGNLRPGQWLSENEVAALLGVSRAPVRDAFRQFAREGLLEVRRRRGTILADLTAAQADDVYRARQIMDAEMARLAVEQMTDDHVDQLQVIVEHMRRAEGDRPQIYEATRLLWQFLMDLCPNRTIGEIVALLWRQSIRMRGITLALPEAQEHVRDFYEQFLEAARAHDAGAAGKAMAEQIDFTRQLLLEQVFIEMGDGALVPRQPA
jgi:DNA-binding GntR family transcriptional regulator